jgi:hypothetical protein
VSGCRGVGPVSRCRKAKRETEAAHQHLRLHLRVAALGLDLREERLDLLLLQQQGLFEEAPDAATSRPTPPDTLDTSTHQGSSLSTSSAAPGGSVSNLLSTMGAAAAATVS